MDIESNISLVDGQQGRLIWRGHTLQEVQSWSFSQLAQMLWQKPVSDLQLGQARQRVTPWIRELLPLGNHLATMDWLRLALDRLPEGQNLDWVAALSMALVLRHNPEARPNPQADHVEDVASMLHLQDTVGLRSYWNCVAEHGMNASTYTARVVASTQAGARAAISAALGALQGPLHGGAPGPVLDMLDQLEASPDPEAWLRQHLQSGQRLMGFGHRIYKVRDPRAEVLRRACQALPQLKQRLELAQQVETLAMRVLEEYKPERQLHTNVEYYTAILLDGVGFDRQDFTAVFACSRVLGWLAHIDEQQQEGRLIRPESRYSGPLPVC